MTKEEQIKAVNALSNEETKTILLKIVECTHKAAKAEVPDSDCLAVVFSILLAHGIKVI